VTDWFSVEEKTCHCGCGLNLVDQNPDFLQALNSAREIYGKPMDANSMTRCARYNKAISTATKSGHLEGRAVDIACRDPRERLPMIMALLAAGFRRIEISAVHVHADMKRSEPNPECLLLKTEKGLV
jgi:hypothetical protein